MSVYVYLHSVKTKSEHSVSFLSACTCNDDYGEPLVTMYMYLHAVKTKTEALVSVYM